MCDSEREQARERETEKMGMTVRAGKRLTGRQPLENERMSNGED